MQHINWTNVLGILASLAVVAGFAWGLVELADKWRRGRARVHDDVLVQRVTQEVTDDIREIVTQVRTNGGTSLLDKINRLTDLNERQMVEIHLAHSEAKAARRAVKRQRREAEVIRRAQKLAIDELRAGQQRLAEQRGRRKR